MTKEFSYKQCSFVLEKAQFLSKSFKTSQKSFLSPICKGKQCICKANCSICKAKWLYSLTKQLNSSTKRSNSSQFSSLLLKKDPESLKKFLKLLLAREKRFLEINFCTSIKSALLSSTRVKSHFHCGKSDVLSKKHFETFLSFAPLAAAQLKKSMPNDYAQECLRSLYACIMQAHLYYNHWVLYQNSRDLY